LIVSDGVTLSPDGCRRRTEQSVVRLIWSELQLTLGSLTPPLCTQWLWQTGDLAALRGAFFGFADAEMRDAIPAEREGHAVHGGTVGCFSVPRFAMTPHDSPHDRQANPHPTR
jgi:hypothetical protein